VLNLLAGLELPSSGTLTLDDKAIAGPGAERGVMFQDYALFPWRTVWGNVEYGLVYGPPDAASPPTPAARGCATTSTSSASRARSRSIRTSSRVACASAWRSRG
jgi:ABC-type nitrate/sulfonate/bicarbonate transport system ATPase subunit